MKKMILAILIVVMITIATLVFDIGRRDNTEPVSFKECAFKGYPISESFPRECRTPDGKVFSEKESTSPNDKSDLIIVDTPLSDEIVKSPLTVKGTARGYWFFEASFPVSLVDGNGNQIALGIAQAEGEWMTTEFVPFKVELNFDKPTTSAGELILKKDNPSGLPEHDDELIIKVKFD